MNFIPYAPNDATKPELRKLYARLRDREGELKAQIEAAKEAAEERKELVKEMALLGARIRARADGRPRQTELQLAREKIADLQTKLAKAEAALENLA